MKKSSQNIDALLERCKRTFNETDQRICINKEYATDLNKIVSRVQWTLETGGDETDIDFAEAALRVVDRVAVWRKVQPE